MVGNNPSSLAFKMLADHILSDSGEDTRRPDAHAARVKLLKKWYKRCGVNEVIEWTSPRRTPLYGTASHFPRSWDCSYSATTKLVSETATAEAAVLAVIAFATAMPWGVDLDTLHTKANGLHWLRADDYVNQTHAAHNTNKNPYYDMRASTATNKRGATRQAYDAFERLITIDSVRRTIMESPPAIQRQIRNLEEIPVGQNRLSLDAAFATIERQQPGRDALHVSIATIQHARRVVVVAQYQERSFLYDPLKGNVSGSLKTHSFLENVNTLFGGPPAPPYDQVTLHVFTSRPLVAFLNSVFESEKLISGAASALARARVQQEVEEDDTDLMSLYTLGRPEILLAEKDPVDYNSAGTDETLTPVLRAKGNGSSTRVVTTLTDEEEQSSATTTKRRRRPPRNNARKRSKTPSASTSGSANPAIDADAVQQHVATRA